MLGTRKRDAVMSELFLYSLFVVSLFLGKMRSSFSFISFIYFFVKKEKEKNLIAAKFVHRLKFELHLLSTVDLDLW